MNAGDILDKQHSQKLIDHIEELIRAGAGFKAREQLLAANISKAPRGDLHKFASLARRAGLIYLSLRILNPIVRSKIPVTPPPSETEITVYGAALARIGALSESEELLSSLDWKRTPEVLFFRTYPLIYRWRYHQVVPLLERYIGSEGISPYQRQVGQVNLVASYIAVGDSKKAWALVDQLREELYQQGHQLLLGNALELSAQLAIFTGEFEKAEEFLSIAQANMTDQNSIYYLYVKKWQVIGRLMMGSDKDVAQRELNEIRTKAKALKDWETLRECDFFWAVATRNQSLFIHVLYGTPSRDYALRIKQHPMFDIKVPPVYDWFRGKVPQNKLDLQTGRDESGTQLIKPGHLPHKLLRILSQDFYRPLSLGMIHDQLFKGEYFNPFTSPHRVNQVVYRLRKWSWASQTGLEIKVNDSEYKLDPGPTTVIRIARLNSQPKIGEERWVAALTHLQEKWPYKSFTMSEAEASSELSRTQLKRCFNWALEQGRIYKDGLGRSTMYRFDK